MVEKFEVNFKSHVRTGETVLILLVLMVGTAVFITYYDRGYVAIFAGWTGMFLLTLPGIFLHINYYLTDRGRTFSYDHTQRIININDGNRAVEFNLDSVLKVEKFISGNLAAGRSSYIPWDNFNYSKIYLKNGEKFIVTSLLVPDLRLPIEDDKISIIHGIFRFVKK